ncbi:MAG: hypothetical protein U5N58_00760 [Actinomycetota bacterium]|nr:hypothetical protein [Actinomycetota bacterium]
MENQEAREILDQLEEDYRQFEKSLSDTRSLKDLEEVKIKYLGKKSQVVSVLKNIGKLSNQLKPVIGKNANIYKKR